MTLRLGLFLSALLAASCNSPPPPDPCTTGFLGDASQPIQLEPFYVGLDGQAHDIVACGTVELVTPPQGGIVAFIGARATNVDGCHVNWKTALRNPTTREVNFDSRKINLHPLPGRPGWGWTDITGGDFMTNGFANVGNIAVCPNVLSIDIQGVDSLLEMTLSERSGRAQSVTVHVVPRCEQSDPARRAACECQCTHDFTTSRCTDPASGGFVSDWDAGDTGDARCSGDAGGG
jgi:hypothetical protein